MGAWALGIALVAPAPAAHADVRDIEATGRAAALPSVSPYGTSVVVDGHGYGHGIGLSQWGALGYAIDDGWSSAQILEHYYGNTTAGTMANDSIGVRLTALDDQQTAVVAANGAVTSVDAFAGTWKTVVARPLGAGMYDVWAHPTEQRCPAPTDVLDATGGWVQLAANRPGSVTEPIDVQLAIEAPDTARDSLVAVCEPSGTVRSYRGTIRAVTGPALEYRTVNVVPIESYLRGVVPVEVSAGWAGLGGGKGMAALEAQAVAARSYAALQTRYLPYAKTCDTQACQVYSGAAKRAGLTAPLVAIEQPNTDTAVTSTAGFVRRTAAGAIANTMFSSSSGGYTAPSTSPGFPAVVDDGDDVAQNPNHNWSKVVPVATVEAAWPSIGSLTQITITQRNGLGADGGRVNKLTVSGTLGKVDMSGDSFRRALDLKSDWFSVRGDLCSGRVAPTITGAAVPSTPGGMLPIAPVRVIDTRNAIGTAPIQLGAGCTLAFDPGARPAGTIGAAIVLTTTGADVDGYTTAYPCATALPNVSAVQILGGMDIPGTTVVPLGADGRVCIYSSVTTDVLVDVMGWLVPAAPAYRAAGSPQRVLDTRQPAPKPPVPAGQVSRVVARGPDGSIPAAVSVNLTATGARSAGYVTAYPCDTTRSETSVLNFRPSVDIANHVFVDVDSNGEFCLWASGDVHLIADLDGVFSSTDPLARPLRVQSPERVIDTRSDIGTVDALQAGASRALDLGAASGGVLAEITVVSPSAAGYLTMYPCDDTTGAGNTSVVNAPARTNVANVVLMRTDSEGRICVFSTMPTDLLVDVIGRV